MMTQKKLKKLLIYNKDTGAFKWRKTIGRRAKAGNTAGGLNYEGYRYIKIDGVSYRAPRLAWLYVYGEHPKGQIDHINGIRDDDRITNLRDVPNRVNSQNRVCHRDGKLVGGCYDKRRDKWVGQIRVGGDHKFLGYYDTEQEAHEAYLEALRGVRCGS